MEIPRETGRIGADLGVLGRRGLALGRVGGPARLVFATACFTLARTDVMTQCAIRRSK